MIKSNDDILIKNNDKISNDNLIFKSFYMHVNHFSAYIYGILQKICAGDNLVGWDKKKIQIFLAFVFQRYLFCIMLQMDGEKCILYILFRIVFQLSPEFVK